MTFPFPFFNTGEKPIITAWQKGLTSNASVGSANTARQCIADGLSGSGDKIRVTLAAPTSGSLTISVMRIGTTTPTVDVNNVFDSAPVQLTFGGLPSITLTGGALYTSDWAVMAYTAPKAILIAYHISGSGTERRNTSPGNNYYGYWYRNGADNSSSLSAIGYTWDGFILSTITKIEVR